MSGQENKTASKSQRGPGMPPPMEKANDFKGTWAKLINYCSEYKKRMLLSIVLACLGSILVIVGPNILSDMTDEILAGLLGSIDLELITRLGITLTVIYGLAGLFMFVESFNMASVTAKISRKLRSGVSTKINKLPLSYFDQTSHGDVISRVTNDVDAIGETMFRIETVGGDRIEIAVSSPRNLGFG